MNVGDVARFALGTLRGYGSRTVLMLLAMAIGVTAVVLLTSLGEGARRFVISEFASLGTNLLIVMPGRSETAGISPSLFLGVTPRDLTIDDAVALTRSPLVRRVAPMVVGSAPAAWGGREREVPVLGSSASLQDIRRWDMAQGRFLPIEDLDKADPICVLGEKVRNELFGTAPALGQWLRIGERRCRVIGILASTGRSLGLDIQELVIMPVASAQMLFNQPSLYRIYVEAQSRDALPRVQQFVRATLRIRHQGEEDVTVITQDAVLATFDRILRALTFTVGGIAAISLAVAGILIMNVMLIAVSQRTAEIGLLKALGAPRGQILTLFLVEAALLSLFGALVGVAVGEAGAWLLRRLYPVLPATVPWWAVAAATGVAVVMGVSFGVLPARRAARLDPVQALSHR